MDAFDTSGWPCMTPGKFWALSEGVTHAARLVSVQHCTAQYHVDLTLSGRVLKHFNALTELAIDGPPGVTSATLSIGSAPVESVRLDYSDTVHFQIFRHAVVPLFVLKEPLVITLHFQQPVERASLPESLAQYVGLLGRLKLHTGPMFIAGGPDACLTWDGEDLHIRRQSDDDADSLDLSVDRFVAVHDPHASYRDLWRATPLSDD